MGGRRLPREKVAGLIAVAVVITGTACAGSRPHDGATTTAEASQSPSETATASPPATPTPDQLAIAPRTSDDARSGLEAEIRAAPTEACPARLRTSWNVRCASADLDGDGKADTAYLVPLQPAGRTGAAPAAVFVLRSGDQSLAEIRLESEADASRMGQEFFAAINRTVDGRTAQVSVLSAACTATGCTYGIHLETWDGTAWRDIGPTETIDFLDRVEFAQSRGQFQLLAHTGVVQAAGAGPTRATTLMYTFDGRRFAQRTESADKPVYLFHAIEDADAKFQDARLS